MKRALISLIAGAALLVAPISAIAADDATAPLPPLPPGGVAGVEQAQLGDVPILWWLGGALILGAAILIISNTDDPATPVDTPAPPTTGTF